VRETTRRSERSQVAMHIEAEADLIDVGQGQAVQATIGISREEVT
jgi:hypothetical protein